MNTVFYTSRLWLLKTIGGQVEVGETITEVLKWEVKEESGIDWKFNDGSLILL